MVKSVSVIQTALSVWANGVMLPKSGSSRLSPIRIQIMMVEAAPAAAAIARMRSWRSAAQRRVRVPTAS